MIRPGECSQHSSGPLRVMRGGGLLSGYLQLADFVAVRADGRFPLRTAADVLSLRARALTPVPSALPADARSGAH
jgi:hypothetical protein